MKILLTTFILITSILSFTPVVFAQKDFPADDASTAAYVELCKNTADEEARSFCFGFGEGVYQAYLASRPPNAKPTICFADKNDTRNEVLQKFLSWNNTNPQFNKDKAAKTLMRFFTDHYSCKK
jgi:hypothetical protein